MDIKTKFNRGDRVMGANIGGSYAAIHFTFGTIRDVHVHATTSQVIVTYSIQPDGIGNKTCSDRLSYSENSLYPIAADMSFDMLKNAMLDSVGVAVVNE